MSSGYRELKFGIPDQVRNDMKKIMKISTLQYAKTLFELTDGKSEQEALNIVKKFAEQLKVGGQLKNSSKIMDKFSQLYNEKHAIVEVVVTSRENLKLEAVAEIVEFIKSKYAAKDVKLENVVDEKIMGGVIIRVGDEILDGSVALKLKKLKKILSN